MPELHSPATPQCRNAPTPNKLNSPVLPPNALTHRSVLLSGVEDYPRRKALARLLEEAGGEAFDSQVFLAGESDPAEWFGSAATAPFLSQRRVVIVRNLLRAGPPEEAFPSAIQAAKDLPETALLLLVADEELGDLDRVRKLDGIRSAWEAWAKKAGALLLTFSGKDEDARKAVIEESKTLGKAFSPKALDLLLEMSGGSLSHAMEELEKLAVYAGDESRISEAHVQAVVVPWREYNVYHLVDAALSGNPTKALQQLQILLDSNQKMEEAAFQRIFPTITRQLRLIWQARVCIEAGCSPQNAPEKVLSAFLEKPNLSMERDWVQKNAMRTARSASLAQLAECFAALEDANAEIIGLLPGFSTYDTLERMVLRMCRITSMQGKAIA